MKTITRYFHLDTNVLAINRCMLGTFMPGTDLYVSRIVTATHDSLPVSCLRFTINSAPQCPQVERDYAHWECWLQHGYGTELECLVAHFQRDYRMN